MTKMFKVLSFANLHAVVAIAILTEATAKKPEEYEVITKDDHQGDTHKFATLEQAQAFIGGEFVPITEEEKDSYISAWDEESDPSSTAFEPEKATSPSVAAPTDDEMDDAVKEKWKSETADAGPDETANGPEGHKHEGTQFTE